MNKLKNLLYILGISIMVILPACSEPDDELTSVDYDRLFSPTDLKATVVNRTSVRLTWSTFDKKTDTYTIEVYDNATFEGTPVKSLSDIVVTEYTIAGFEGEKEYWARVQAVSASIPSSKWTEVTFTTSTEEILLASEDDDIAATQVTLRWPAGEVATEIVINPGDIRHTVTAAEIAAGVATITGLTSETKYTAKLMNGTKTRGTLEFETLLDLGGAIAVKPEDDFATMLSAASAGDIFALYPGTYGTSTKFVVKADVEIKAVRPNDKPIISGYFSIEDGASLLLKELVVDGTGNESNQAIIFSTAAATYGALTVEGCEIKNHEKGLYYLNVASSVESITFNNCLIYNIVCDGGDFMDSRVGAIKTLTLSNSTVYNSCAARDFIRYDNAASNFPGISPVINITNCTLDGVANTTSRRLLYIRFAGNSINFKNNIVTNTAGIFSNQASTAVPTFGGNNFFGAPNLFSGGATANFYDNSATNHNPQYKDAAAGDFTVNNIDVTVGDPRWLN